MEKKIISSVYLTTNVISFIHPIHLLYLIDLWNQGKYKIKAYLYWHLVERTPKGVRKKYFYYLCSGTCIGYICEEYLLSKTRGHEIKVIRMFITELQRKNNWYPVVFYVVSLEMFLGMCMWGFQVLVTHLKSWLMTCKEKHKNPLIILLCKSNRVDVHILRGCAKWTTIVLITLTDDIDDFYRLFHTFLSFELFYKDKSSRQYYKHQTLCVVQSLMKGAKILTSVAL